MEDCIFNLNCVIILYQKTKKLCLIRSYAHVKAILWIALLKEFNFDVSYKKENSIFSLHVFGFLYSSCFRQLENEYCGASKKWFPERDSVKLNAVLQNCKRSIAVKLISWSWFWNTSAVFFRSLQICKVLFYRWD